MTEQAEQTEQTEQPLAEVPMPEAWEHRNPDTMIYGPDTNSEIAMIIEFIQLQQKLENPKRDASGFHGNRYAKLETILAEVRPVANEYGFAIIQGPAAGSYRNDRMVTMLLHVHGGRIISSIEFPHFETAQEYVSFSTYMRRVQLTSLLGIRDEDDDDGYAASTGPTAAPAAAPMQPAVAAPAATQPMAAAAPVATPQQATQWTQAMMQGAPAAAPAATAPAAAPAVAPPPAAAPIAQPQAAAPPVQAIAPQAAVPATIVGEQLAEMQAALNAVEQGWGQNMKLGILQTWGVNDVPEVPASTFEVRMGQIDTFCAGQGKRLVRSGPPQMAVIIEDDPNAAAAAQG